MKNSELNSEILALARRIRAGETTARVVVEKSLAAAEKHEELHFLLEIFPDEALKKADEVDAKIARGEKVGKLAGVPYVAKDNFLTTVGRTTAAAKFLENFHAPLDATAIERIENEDAILIGKANLDAFAHGGSTENSAFGPTKNAIDASRVAGGSSGGSAVAVAAGVVPFALGTDTGGSIRQPASFNGVVGYKPTYGMISRYGVVAMASSTDVIGPIARTPADAALIAQILAGPDQKDATVHDNYFAPDFLAQDDNFAAIFSEKSRTIPAKSAQTSGENLENCEKYSIPTPRKIGLISEFISDGVDEDVKNQTLKLAEKLREAGHIVENVSLKMAKYALPIYYIVVPAELSSNLARFDGVRYGVRATAENLGELYGLSRNQGFVDENKRRILIGAFVLSSGYFDAYYLQAEKARTLLIREFDDLFVEYDFLIGPTAPMTAFKIGEKTADPLTMYLADIMTVSASLTGLPAVSLPNGFSRENLPIGIQVMAPQKKDATLLAFSQEILAISGEKSFNLEEKNTGTGGKK